MPDQYTGYRYPREKTDHLHHWIRANTVGCRAVADFGAGTFDKLTFVWPPAKRIGIEVFPGHVMHVDTNAKVVLGDFRQWRRYLSGPEIDCAMMIDSLEHISKADGVALLRDMQDEFNRILVFTPDGLHPQGPSEDGNEFNAHECGWTEEELKAEGFEVVRDTEFHGPKGGALFAVWERVE